MTLNMNVTLSRLSLSLCRESTIKISNVICDSMRNLLCPSLKTLHSKRTWRRVSTMPSRVIQEQQLCSCGGLLRVFPLFTYLDINFNHLFKNFRHGIYCWGESWQQAKTQCECYDYLFNIAVDMKKCGLSPNEVPVNYRK